jgi:hypothetical protein
LRRRAALVGFVLLVLPLAASARKGRLNMPPGWTWPPSAGMKADGKACLAHLSAIGVGYRKAPAVRKVATPIYLSDMMVGGIELQSIWKKGPFVMDCLLAAAIADQADVFASAGVTALRFAEIHDYRNINDGKRGVLSRHALGLAIDVFAFVTEDGVVHAVEKDYPDALLLTLEEWLQASEAFRLLTPGSDPRHHHDHFHLEVRAAGERPRSRVAIR